jgi:hypothetical protein
MRRWQTAALALMVAAPLHGATFTLCSQNTLHLGYKSSTKTKVDTLKAEFNQCDITLLQEVMRDALTPTGALRKVTPDPGIGFTWNVPYTEVIGKTTYKESYSFIVKSTFNIATTGKGGFLIHFPLASLAQKFSRPPASILVQTGTTWTWLTNFHAIFGDYQYERENEVKAMALVADELGKKNVGGQTYSRIIIGGDWNLNAKNSAYDDLVKKRGFTVEPNTQTSLTTTGSPSQPYDHFAWSGGMVVKNTTVITPTTSQTWWRANVSDHMGIKCTVTY